MLLSCGNKTIEFRLGPGVYTDWSSDSATGKTYTCKFLNSLIEYGRRDILVISYDLVKSAGIDQIIRQVVKGNYSLIFADRADLYVTRDLYTALLNSGAVVYLDSKDSCLNPDICGRECYIDFTKEGFVYYEDDT